tara:strand:- start:8631 stop:9974 length:1344 start_codon:yes stop_codon:yes gene_type:complete
MPGAASARAHEALERLARLHPKLIDLGLGRSLELLEKLGQPQHHLPPVIHLAGTNGKGSTLSFLRAMLEAEGKSIHAYTSPHLVRFHERIRLAGTLIDDQRLADLLEEVETVNGDEPMTFFEVTTAAAMLAFTRVEADYTLLETGLGGRMDSTNVVDQPLATVITPIARDHEHFLGNTLTAIAREKAGIMRAGVPVFCARQPHAEAMEELASQAEKIGANLLLSGRDFMISRDDRGVTVQRGGREILIPRTGLNGPHQGDNAGLAAAVLMEVAPAISDAAIIRGAEAAYWPARVQHLTEGRLVEIANTGNPDARNPGAGTPIWLDGAHNAHGAEALARSLDGMGKAPWVIVCGALNTRPPEEFLKPLSPLLCHAVTLAIPGNEASLSAQTMADAARANGLTAETATDILDAVEKAAATAERHGGGIIISGSLYLGGYALDANGTLPV